MHLLRASFLAALQQKKTPWEIPRKYEEYTSVFSPDLAMELLENMGINKQAIELVEGK